jgi:hypothetical protein
MRKMFVALYGVAVNKLCDQPDIREGKGHVRKICTLRSPPLSLFLIKESVKYDSCAKK